jgi:HAD superfamily hydrolase (TIGR01509 family)
VHAVVFDMDGVLVDSEPLHVEATRLLLAECGVEYGHAQDDFFGFSDEEVFRVLKARHRLEASVEDLARRWVERVRPLIAVSVRPLPGVPAVLAELGEAGLRLALASGSSPELIEATLDALGIRARFDHVVSARDVGRGKPAPDIFLEAARRLQVHPGGALVVEDSRNGLLAARRAGMPCAVIPCPSTRLQDFTGAAVRLTALSELPAWLRTWNGDGER